MHPPHRQQRPVKTETVPPENQKLKGFSFRETPGDSRCAPPDRNLFRKRYLHFAASVREDARWTPHRSIS